MTSVSSQWEQDRAGEESTSGPVRPTLPPVLLYGLGLWLGAAKFVEGPGTLSVGIALSLGILGFILPMAYVWLRSRKRWLVADSAMRVFGRHLLLVVGGISVGCALGAAYSYHYAALVEDYSGAKGEFVIRATEDGRSGTYGDTIVGTIVSINGSPVSDRVKVQVRYTEGNLWYRDTFRVWGKLQGGSSTYLRQRGIIGTLTTADSIEVIDGDVGLFAAIAKIRKVTVDAIRTSASIQENSAEILNPEVVVLEALVCGYRYDLFAGDAYDNFKIAGLGHLVAVSGAHLSVMFGLLTLLLKTLRLKKKLSLSLQVLALLVYLLFSAIPISALRAAVMVSLGLFAFVFGRRPATLNALGFCIVAIVLTNPTASLSASFVLSATSTMGIVLFAGLAEWWISKLLPMVPKAISSALALTLSASCLSLPFSCAYFSQCSTVSLLSNLLCAPLFTLACCLGLVSAVVLLGLPGLAELLFAVAVSCTGVLCQIVEWCAAIPYACIPMDVSMGQALGFTLLSGLLLWRLWPVPNVKATFISFALVLVMVVILASATRFQDRVVMMDVGQGDAILLQSGGQSILIDTGDEPALLRQALARANITRLSAVVITHPDKDHCGSLQELSLVCELETVIVAADTLECDCQSCLSLLAVCEGIGAEVRGLVVGDAIDFGRFSCEVIWPSAFIDEGGNDDSLCLLVEVETSESTAESTPYRLLFTGDAGYESLSEAFPEQPYDIDVLKVSHHGSYTGLDEPLMQQLSPEIALISVGENNRYGHPHAEVLELLAEANCEVYRTDLCGDISLKFTTQGVKVSTQR